MRRLAHPLVLAALALAVSIQAPASAADADEVKALLSNFKTEMRARDPAARKASVAIVSATKDRKVASALVKYLGDPDPGVRAAVCKAIGEQGDARVTAKLHTLLRGEKVTSVRIAICAALAKAPTKKTVTVLGDLAKELLNVCGDEELARAVLRALSDIKHPSSVDALIDIGRRTERTAGSGDEDEGPSLVSFETLAWLDAIQPHVFAALEKLTKRSYTTPLTWARWWSDNRRGYQIPKGPEDIAVTPRYRDEGYGFKMDRPGKGWRWSRPTGAHRIVRLFYVGSGSEVKPDIEVVVTAKDVNDLALKTPEERKYHWDAWSETHLRDVRDLDTRTVGFGGEKKVILWSAKGSADGRDIVALRYVALRGELMVEVEVTLKLGSPREAKKELERALGSFRFL